MDDPTSKNVTETTFVLPTSTLSTDNQEQRNIATTQQSITPQNDKMRERITYLVLSLFILIVIYGLFIQNLWLVGIVCFPVIAVGVQKIFNRYL